METRNFLSKGIEKLGVLILTLFFGALAFAQENAPSDLDVDVDMTKTTSTEEWFTNPIVWIIAALLFIVLIAVVARGNGRRD